MSRLILSSILLIVAYLYCFDFGRSKRCRETASRTTTTYTSCGFLWLSRCSRRRTTYYTVSKCCPFWTGPSCDVPICGDLSIPNGTVSILSSNVSMMAYYSCDRHYQLTGGNRVRDCTPDGDWEGHPPSCAYMNSCSSSPCLHGGNCTDVPNNYTCMCPKAWNGTRCETNIVDCGIPEDIANGTLTMSGTKYGDLAIYICKDPHIMISGDVMARCGMDSRWNGTKPSCAYMNSCSSSPCLHGGNCTDVPNSYTCMCPKAWNGTRCETNIVDCGIPDDIADGTVTISGTKYGDLAIYKCRDRYIRISGNAMARCGIDSRWNGTKPSCACKLDEATTDKMHSPDRSEQTTFSTMILPIVCIGVLLVIIVVLVLIVFYVWRRKKSRENQSNNSVRYNNRRVFFQTSSF